MAFFLNYIKTYDTMNLGDTMTIRGVNLGGWFVLESWMRPALFEGLKGPDETHFMLNKKDAKAHLINHYQTFITERDFEYLNRLNVKHLRLPVPWWYLGESPYIESKDFIHQAYKWADKYDMHILLDLHTAPGCQNGFDNGGITGVIDWPKDPKNIDLTIDKLESLVKEYKDYKSFYGIEVLNEPHVSIDMNIIIDFYQRSYDRLRVITDKLIVFHDAFRPTDPMFKPFFKDKVNVAFDLHLYHCFNEALANGTKENHIEEVLRRHQMIQEIETYVRVIIGEWSLGLRESEKDFKDTFSHDLFIKLLTDAQLFAYNQAFGFYFWSYKIDRESHLNWDFRRMVEKGFLPNKF